MTTEEGLMAAILANPADDLPRLVYADYLEENGEAERAEFIRVQCRLHKWEFGSPAEHGTAILRERELWSSGTVPLREWFGVVGQDVNLFLGSDTTGIQTSSRPAYVIRRGFVAEVRCTLSQWCGGECGRYPTDEYHTCDLYHAAMRAAGVECPDCGNSGRTTGIGPSVVRSHPVEVVRVTDREPDTYGSSARRFFRWVDADRGDRLGGYGQFTVPQQVFAILEGDHRGYPTRESALSALSAALIAWAKDQPPVTAVVNGVQPRTEVM